MKPRIETRGRKKGSTKPFHDARYFFVWVVAHLNEAKGLPPDRARRLAIYALLGEKQGIVNGIARIRIDKKIGFNSHGDRRPDATLPAVRGLLVQSIERELKRYSQNFDKLPSQEKEFALIATEKIAKLTLSHDKRAQIDALIYLRIIGFDFLEPNGELREFAERENLIWQVPKSPDMWQQFQKLFDYLQQ